MTTLATPRQNAPRRTPKGQRMWACPSSIDPTVLHPAGCRNCLHRDAHDVAEHLVYTVPHGQHRYGLVTAAQQYTVDTINRIQSGVNVRAHTHYGKIGHVLYNAGPAGDNATQFINVRVTGGGVGYVDVVGMNPKAFEQGSSRTNPEYPFADPVTGTYGRLVWGSDTAPIMIGNSAFAMHYPSVLFSKMSLLISAIEPVASTNPNEVAFRLLFADGADWTHATAPWDAAFPADEYFGVIAMEQLRPPRWVDPQAPKEIQWTPTKATLSGPSVHFLRNTAAGHTRIIPPTVAGAWTAFSTHNQEVDLSTRIATTLVGDEYRTTLDLTGLHAEITVFASYYCESLEEDATRIPGLGQCTNSKRCPSGSFDDEGGSFCAKRASASAFATYHEHCWQPQCSGFALVDESLNTAGDDSLIVQLHTRAGWIVVQGMPGVSSHRNFWLEQKGGPSIQGLVGSYCDQTPSGFHSQRQEWVQRALGRRITWTDSEGNQYQALEHGAYYLSPYDHTATEGPSYIPDAHGTLQHGIIADAVDGWMEGKSLPYPHKGSSTTNVYSYESDSGGLNNVTSLVESEAYIVAVDPGAAADPDLGTRIINTWGDDS